MPVMDGYETTRRLRATEVGRTTCIIAVSASVFDDERIMALEVGVDGYLKKPFRQEELIKLLEKGLGLRYIYGEMRRVQESQPVTEEGLALLPKTLIRAMLDAVAEGDMTRLTELTGQVEKIDLSLAHALQAMAKQYKYSTLNEWLEKAENASE